jgi:YceI-like domain
MSERTKRFDQSSAVCQVFTYKEGLLSTLAYDLRINVTSFVIDVGENEHFISARFDAESLRVDCAMVEGAERPDILTSWEKAEIEGNILKEVLDTKTYKDIVLTSSSVKKEDSAYFVKAVLALHGAERKISFTVKEEKQYYEADVRLRLPDYGIRPFSALFGAIRLKPDILIRVRIPREADEESDDKSRSLP